MKNIHQLEKDVYKCMADMERLVFGKGEKKKKKPKAESGPEAEPKWSKIMMMKKWVATIHLAPSTINRRIDDGRLAVDKKLRKQNRCNLRFTIESLREILP